jgi:hypothetical protein
LWCGARDAGWVRCGTSWPSCHRQEPPPPALADSPLATLAAVTPPPAQTVAALLLLWHSGKNRMRVPGAAPNTPTVNPAMPRLRCHCVSLAMCEFMPTCALRCRLRGLFPAQFREQSTSPSGIDEFPLMTGEEVRSSGPRAATHGTPHVRARRKRGASRRHLFSTRERRSVTRRGP